MEIVLLIITALINMAVISFDVVIMAVIMYFGNNNYGFNNYGRNNYGCNNYGCKIRSYLTTVRMAVRPIKNNIDLFTKLNQFDPYVIHHSQDQ